MTNLRIAVLGAGANGGAIAAALTDVGADAVAVDPWPAHVERMRAEGLTVRDSEGRERVSPVRALHVCQLAEQRARFDIVVLGVKAYDTRWACELVKPYLADDGFIVGVQNGVTLDTVADIVGPDRSVGAVIEVAANLMQPGVVVQEAPMWLALGGETPAAQERASIAAEALAPAATTVVVDDIRSAKWMKLVANACELVPSAILDLPLAEAISRPGIHEFMLATGEEALAVALRAGQRIVPIFGNDVDEATLHPNRYVEHLLGVVLETYTSPTTLTTVLQDWRKGRRAEIDQLNGYVVEMCAVDGGSATDEALDAPLNRRVLDLARAIENGELQAGESLVPSLTGTETG
ncbi:2-dehydropantoate 2-reductase N-terminal domain-containing protein [Leucobacter sp. USCH14]|uniref:ketopantoate reductase family protein n=1 Tax=Leucobacter sp. USCH14 TaxID=3024838 RepID=UPI00309A856E